MAKGTSKDPQYGGDYTDTGAFKAIADKYKVAMLLVHHLRKQNDHDPFNRISGSTGVSGAADTLMILDKKERNATTALSQVLDLSQPKPDPDLVRKFVSKIVPDGKNSFHWYLNLDGNSAIIQTVMVEGRKNQATVTATVIHIMALLAMAQEEKTCLLGQLHRLQSRNLSN